MKKMTKLLRQGWLLLALACFVSLGVVSIVGCAGKTKTSVVTTEITSGISDRDTTKSVTTQKEVETSAHPRGVIGGVFYTIGQILIFPFRVIGNLFS